MVQEFFSHRFPDVALDVEQDVLVNPGAAVTNRLVADCVPAARAHPELLERCGVIATPLVLRTLASPVGGIVWHRTARL